MIVREKYVYIIIKNNECYDYYIKLYDLKTNNIPIWFNKLLYHLIALLCSHYIR